PAEWTTTRDGRPSTSTKAGSWRPFTFLPAFRRLQRLAIDDGGRRAGLAAPLFAQGHEQLIPNPLPHAFVLELAENVVDRRAWRKGIAGQITPGATGAQQIEDRVHRRTHVGLARSSACLGRGDQRLQPRPLRI